MYGSGHAVADFIPNHLVKLTDRLALGLDGESQRSQSYFFAQWRLWQWGDGVWYEPTFFMPEHQGARCDAGRFIRMLLRAVEAELDFIPPICVVCNMPRFSECPGCGTH
jgi:hypothetical protein